MAVVDLIAVVAVVLVRLSLDQILLQFHTITVKGGGGGGSNADSRRQGLNGGSGGGGIIFQLCKTTWWGW